MTINEIKNDIQMFNDNYFNELLNSVDANFEFIDSNNLFQAKNNYLFLLPYLNASIKYFSSLDYRLMDATFQKLHTDINNLHEIYQIQKRSLSSIKELFNKKFLPKVPLFIDMKDELYTINNSDIQYDEDKETIQLIHSHYDAMKEIYFENFQTLYIKDSRYILNSLEEILNSKIYYLDKMLWLEAPKLDNIWRALKVLKIDSMIDSKKYLEYRLKVSLPYTDEYKYLKQCLRIYQ